MRSQPYSRIQIMDIRIFDIARNTPATGTIMTATGGAKRIYGGARGYMVELE